MLTNAFRNRREKPTSGNPSPRLAFETLAKQLEGWVDKSVISQMGQKFPSLYKGVDSIAETGAWEMASPDEAAVHEHLSAFQLRVGLAKGMPLEVLLTEAWPLPSGDPSDEQSKRFVCACSLDQHPSSVLFKFAQSKGTRASSLTAKCFFNHDLAPHARKWITLPLVANICDRKDFSSKSTRFDDATVVSHMVRFGGGRDSFTLSVDGIFVEDHSNEAANADNFPFEAFVQIQIVDDFIM